MLDYLKIKCDPDLWLDMPAMEKLQCEIQASDDVVAFWNHECMGGQTLWKPQEKILREIFSLDENKKRKYTEILMEAGRQGGKTTIAALVLLTELYKLLMLENPQKHYKLLTGTPITLFMITSGEKQTMNTIYGRVRQLIEASPYFSSFDKDVTVTHGKIEFPKNVILEAVGSNVRTAVGRTVKILLVDEINSIGTDGGDTNPRKVYTKLSKSTTSFMPFQEDIRVAFSSRVAGYDYLTELIQNATENKSKHTLILKKTARQMNPNLTEDNMKDEKVRDEDSYNTEYGEGEPMDGNRFFNPTLLDRIIETKKNIFTVPDAGKRGRFVPDLLLENYTFDPNSKFYGLYLDPSTINDAFGLTVAHVTLDGHIIIDGVTILRSNKHEEINPIDVENLVNGIKYVIPLQYCVYDIYVYNEMRQRLVDNGIEVIQHNLNLADWNQFKDQLSAQSVHLCKNPYFEREFKELIIKNAIKVEKPQGGSKDMLDSVCQAATFPFRERKEENVRPQIIAGVVCEYR